MNALDPRLQRLREIEARIAFGEYHIQEQRNLAARLARLGLDNSLAHKLLRSMEDSLAILRLRQSDMLGTLQAVEAPAPAVPPRSLRPG
jgi:uncharacterized coiled-coil protein SlyX